MLVNGCDCSIVIKTAQKEFDVPYSDETIREDFILLQEEAAIEGNGVCRAIRKRGGATGCFVTPLTIGTAPLLLSLAMGSAGVNVFVSETRNLYRQCLILAPFEDSVCFDLVQDRQGIREKGKETSERLLFEGCRVRSFELRILRGEAIKLKIDICGEYPAVSYPYNEIVKNETGERFNGDYVNYKINGKEYTNIYGLTFIAKKESGTKTEVWIKRSLEEGSDIPQGIDELEITARLLRDKYEYRCFGMFRIKITGLVLVSDETEINAADSVIGPLRYYVTGNVETSVFTNNDWSLA